MENTNEPLIKDKTKALIIPHVSINEERVAFCAVCNGEGGFQFSIDPDDCKLCVACNGKGTI